MILLRSTLLCVRKKFRDIRPISIGPIEDRRKNLPSRKYYEELTENVYMQNQMSRSGRRAFELLVENPIIVKKFFISDVNDEDIKYPEVLSKNDIVDMKNASAHISDYFTNHIEYDENGFPPSVYESFKDKKLFGYNVPKEYGGQGFTHTQCTVAGEIEVQNIDAAVALNHHRLVCAAITEIGSDEQCAKYLLKLANGEIIGTTAFQEWNRVDKIGLNTRAEYDEDNEQWCLNGTKSFVVNAANANLFLVTAQTEVSDRKGDKKNAFSIFLVDSNLPGIRRHGKIRTIGRTNLYQASIRLEDVILSKDAILSIPGSGDYIQRKIQIHSRIRQGLLHLAQMKHILQYMMNMIESTEHETESENQNTEMHALRLKIGEHASSIYALESMLYLTTGIMDKYNHTNVDLETAIFKVNFKNIESILLHIYSQKQLLDMTKDLLNFVDTRVTLNEHPLNQLIRNSIQLNFDELNNELKMHIGSEGVQYRLKRMIEEVTIKNNKDFVIKSFMEERQLDSYEPELRKAAENLFDSIKLLRLGASTLLTIEARDLPQKHIEMQKVADAAACIYASFACLLRADRSLKLKLPSASDEAFIAQTICDKNAAEVDSLMDYINDGPVKTFSRFHTLLTQLMLEKGANFPAHPLASLF